MFVSQTPLQYGNIQYMYIIACALLWLDLMIVLRVLRLCLLTLYLQM
jgi:hypothetical protein